MTLTWGNASGIDRGSGLVAIKPSGVAYAGMNAGDIVVVDLAGNVVEGERHPSTDLPTHLVLYRTFPEIGGVVHTHSTWATAWAQAGREIPILGTTHADLCPGPVPVARHLTDDEVAGAYEENTGVVLVEAIRARGIDEVPCALVPGHGPFAWGADAAAGGRAGGHARTGGAHGPPHLGRPPRGPEPRGGRRRTPLHEEARTRRLLRATRLTPNPEPALPAGPVARTAYASAASTASPSRSWPSRKSRTV